MRTRDTMAEAIPQRSLTRAKTPASQNKRFGRVLQLGMVFGVLFFEVGFESLLDHCRRVLVPDFVQILALNVSQVSSLC